MAAILSVTALQEILCPPKAETPALTPFSAVVPPRFITIPRLNDIVLTLETIQEEENEEEISMDVSQNSSLSPSPPPPSSSLLSPCFFEAKKLLSSFSHNCKCAYSCS
ncbi:hypothetical protein V6N13_063076 [Hibiscus sabdariffa]|uniref:Uncharacterized protein n=2 Tax=Hibiscus sabdariffa TaxID=183260 RepID=A0ABR2C416_9ROSI